MNDFQKEAVELFYGKGSKIKIHSWNYNNKGDTIYFEVIIILADVIDEYSMDKTMAEELLKNALIYFYPEIRKVVCVFSFDV